MALKILDFIPVGAKEVDSLSLSNKKIWKKVSAIADSVNHKQTRLTLSGNDT